MTDPEIIAALQNGDCLSFGMNGRNLAVMELMAKLESAKLIRTDNECLTQETRRRAVWIANDRRAEKPAEILASLNESK